MLTYLSQFFSILSDLKCYRNAFSRSKKSVLTCKAKRTTKKKKSKKNTFFRIAKHVFNYFSSFGPFLFHRCMHFSFFVQIEWFKPLWNCHLKFYKSFCNSKCNKIIFKDFFEGFGNRLWTIWSKVFFFVKMTPLLQGAVTFSILVHFCRFLMRQMRQEEGSIYFLDTINNGPSSKNDKQTLP
jgi:hypothetical protein